MRKSEQNKSKLNTVSCSYKEEVSLDIRGKGIVITTHEGPVDGKRGR